MGKPEMLADMVEAGNSPSLSPEAWGVVAGILRREQKGPSHRPSKTALQKLENPLMNAAWEAHDISRFLARLYDNPDFRIDVRRKGASPSGRKIQDRANKLAAEGMKGATAKQIADFRRSHGLL